jgi:hypothetical protein
VDFLDGDYALEFKRIEQEPLTADGRVAKIAEFAAKQAAKGEASAKNDVVRFSRHASQDYWGKFLGVSARCQLEKRVETRRSSNANANSDHTCRAHFHHRAIASSPIRNGIVAWCCDYRKLGRVERLSRSEVDLCFSGNVDRGIISWLVLVAEWWCSDKLTNFVRGGVCPLV